MKIRAALAALPIAALAACTATPTAAAPPTTATPVAAQTVQAASTAWTQARYLAQVRAIGAGTTITQQTDADLIDSGHTLCRDIDHGATWQSWSEQARTFGVDLDLFRRLLRAAVLTYCPEHADVLP